jgi:hypothetical protein
MLKQNTSFWKWDETDELVGRHIEIETCYGEYEPAVVLAVGTDSTGRIKVQSLIDGEVLVGNQWEDVR